MKNLYLLLLVSSFYLVSCTSTTDTEKTAATTESGVEGNGGQANVKDDTSNPNIVQVAASSKDHTTLVAAVKAAGLVDALSNVGPFTVYAPTNAAFDKLPAGTVDGLLKPENKDALRNILEYHTYVGVLKTDYMGEGGDFEQVNAQKIKITKKDGKYYVNGTAEIVASIPTSNGIIHVINEVLSTPK